MCEWVSECVCTCVYKRERNRIENTSIFRTNTVVFSKSVLVAQSCLTLCDPVVCPWNSPGKNTGVGCHYLLQGIFLMQGFSPGLLHCRQILYSLSYHGSLIGKLVCPMPRLWRNLLEKMARKLFRRDLHWEIKTMKFYCVSVLSMM